MKINTDKLYQKSISENRVYHTFSSGTFFQRYRNKYLRLPDERYVAYHFNRTRENGMVCGGNHIEIEGKLQEYYSFNGLTIEKVLFGDDIYILINGMSRTGELSEALIGWECLDHQCGIFGMSMSLRFRRGKDAIKMAAVEQPLNFEEMSLIDIWDAIYYRILSFQELEKIVVYNDTMRKKPESVYGSTVHGGNSLGFLTHSIDESGYYELYIYMDGYWEKIGSVLDSPGAHQTLCQFEDNNTDYDYSFPKNQNYFIE
jgi:hypothetical protein